MKLYSETQLQEKAKEVFAHPTNKDRKELLATSDGNFFYPEKESLAKNHAKTGGRETPLKIYRIERQTEKAKAPAKPEGSNKTTEDKKPADTGKKAESGKKEEGASKPSAKKTESKSKEEDEKLREKLDPEGQADRKEEGK